MKFLKKILNATEIVAKEYTVLYYNEDSKSVNVKGSLKPQITITTADALDTDIIALTATKNETVQGDITWSCNLATDIAEINGSTLTFKQHYEGSVVLTATADNTNDSKTITVTCEEIATATTYSIKANSISVAESQPMDAESTSATVNFVGITTQHYKLKDSVSVESNETQTVEFAANETENEVTRYGSFKWNKQSVNWSINLKLKPFIPEFVDLGLPSGLLWAKCNIGAKIQSERGYYFQWGETVGHDLNAYYEYGYRTEKYYIWSTAPFNNGSSEYDSTYFASVSGTVCPNGVLATQYDAATAAYGEGYRMPTSEEFEELFNNTSSSYDYYNNVQGIKFTSLQDPTKYIFIPNSTPVYYNSPESPADINNLPCYLWTSSLNNAQVWEAHVLETMSGDGYYENTRTRYRCEGLKVRAVKPKNV